MRRTKNDDRQLGLFDTNVGPALQTEDAPVVVPAMEPEQVLTTEPAIATLAEQRFKSDESIVTPFTPSEVEGRHPFRPTSLDPSTKLRTGSAQNERSASFSEIVSQGGSSVRERSVLSFESPGESSTAPSDPLATALRLERNLALMAGAGTGKTHSLITLALHLLGGARSQGAIQPSELCLLTFTDKAAAEMRQRLYNRVDALTRDASCVLEPDLLNSYTSLNLPLPKASDWRHVRDQLGSAPIGTFHGLCVQLLREAPANGQRVPQFELLDELTTRELLVDSADRVCLDALEKAHAGAAALLKEWGLSGTMGVSASLTTVFRRVREEGLCAKDLQFTDAASAVAQFNASLARFHDVLTRAISEPARALKPEQRRVLSEVQQLADGLDLQNAAERVSKMLEVLKPSRSYSEVRAALSGNKTSLGLMNALAAVRIVSHEHTFRELLEALEMRWAEVLKVRRALDFTGLLLETRDLLRDDFQARVQAQRRFKVLLVDELQDTNRLQLEMIHLLAEQREGAPRKVVPDQLGVSLPIEPAALCVVGDRKQSIYEFRGADVSVVAHASAAIVASGGIQAYLQTSRRSSPALVSFFNHVFPRLMQSPHGVLDPSGKFESTQSVPSESFAVSYVPAHDDLSAHRKQELNAPAVERFVQPPEKATADELRYVDARALARRVRELIETENVRGADIALLFRRFSFVEEYRQALLEEGVLHRVVRGRGFYGSQEVMDLASWLKLLGDSSDALSLAVVLRSPLVGLSDSSLLRLSQATGGRLDARQALALVTPPSGFSPFERRRFQNFQNVYSAVSKERHRLSLKKQLQLVLDETLYLEAVAPTAFGKQILANVEKLLAVAARADSEGSKDAHSFGVRLMDLADSDPLEAQAELVDDEDADVVTLCTIHQAKGLEWPVVVLPELFSPLGSFGARARFERGVGLALKSVDAEIGDANSPRFEQAKAERRAREEADFKRLRYVAITRARDRLILGVTQKGAAWFDLDEACQKAPEVLERPLQLPTSIPPLERRSSAAVMSSDELRKGVAAPDFVSRQALLPVTQLQDFVSCPTRYHLMHVMGLKEFFEDTPSQHFEPVDDGSSMSAKERGTLAHLLLEHARLEGPNDWPTLERQLGVAADAQARSFAERFLATDFVKSLKQVRREVAFVLRLESNLLDSPFTSTKLRTGSARDERQAGDERQPRNGPATGEGFTLYLRGAIDLLAVDASGLATIVDYKSSFRPPLGLKPYQFQLSCYVLAAQQMGLSRVRAGVAFLKESDPSPQFFDETSEVASPNWSTKLVEHAQELVRAQVQNRWSTRPIEVCRSLKCGYVTRCHGEAA